MSDIWLDFFAKLPNAIALTAGITFFGFLLAQVIALLFGAALFMTKGYGRALVRIYPFLFRGSPLLIQIFLLYYGLAQIEWVRESELLWNVIGAPFGCMVLAVGLNGGAYSSELIFGALKNLPKSQMEGAKAIGLSRFKTLILIQLPQAYRFLIPALSNELIFILKGSALASAVAMMELTGVTKTFIAKTFSPFEFFIVAGIAYVVIGFVLVRFFRWLEKIYRIPGH